MKKLNIAILTGGNVAERGISLKSAQTIEKFLDSSKYKTYIIELNESKFVEQATGTVLDLNDFSLPKRDDKVLFDLVFLILHGHPAEDGNILGYFDLLGIPCTGCDHFVGALTFNKQRTKDFLRPYQIPMADSRLLYRDRVIDLEDIEKMGFPLFVKPNKNGSSYGVTKVSRENEIRAAVEKAFQFDDEVIVEQFMDGQEFSNGVFRNGQEIVVMPITEIRSDNDFFDYKAKYENESEEITPADLSDELRTQCQQLTRKIYELLNCKGMCRIDYILIDGFFHLLEVNTIPGMSEQSIVPQQVLAMGWTMTDFLDCIVQEALS
ncbi:MAG: D-alanine--D-alanine ligase [Bacteroidota bacterium]